MRKLLDLLGRGIAYIGVCIILGERPGAWRIDAWTRATRERLKREHEEREKVLDKMVQDAMRGAGADSWASESQRGQSPDKWVTEAMRNHRPGEWTSITVRTHAPEPAREDKDYTELPALTGHKPPPEVN